jgi:ribonuclease P/MRP protein subunit POP5
MVRIKHRYLLLNVLYPAEREINPHMPTNSDKPTNSIANKKSTTSSSSTQNKSSQNKTNDPDDLPWTVQFRRPSADSFNAKLLAKVIRDGVEELFGEYGAGMIGASFQGEFSFILLFFFFFLNSR